MKSEEQSSQKHPLEKYLNLVADRLGAKILGVSDEFFAEAEPLMVSPFSPPPERYQNEPPTNAKTAMAMPTMAAGKGRELFAGSGSN